MNKFEQVWTSLNKPEQVWTSVVFLDQCATLRWVVWGIFSKGLDGGALTAASCRAWAKCVKINSEREFLLLKFKHYEKATKFEKNLPPVLTKQLFLLSSVKTSGRFFQIFVAFSEKLDFNKVSLKVRVWKYFYSFKLSRFL